MKYPAFRILLVMFCIPVINGFGQEADFPVLTGPWLGQTPPGRQAVLFAPGIISTEQSEGCSGWGKKMEYFIFQRWIDGNPSLYITHRTDDGWTHPKELPFGQEYRVGDFTIAPSGKTMVFASRKQVAEFGAGEGCDMWRVEKTEAGWSIPEALPASVNTRFHDSYPCLAANRNLYFFSRRPGGIGLSDMYLAEYIDARYQVPVNLGPVLNTEYHEWDSYIAPDEQYMIYCSTMPDGKGEDDLYVTFRQADGSWGQPVHLANGVNSDKSENRPYVSPDGKYLFFASTRRGNRDIYWVDAQVLYDLKR